MKRFYVYKLTHPDTKQFYYGARGCLCEISNDPYIGSMTGWKLSKSEKSILIKEIINSGFTSMDDAILFEASLISKYISDPLNMNYYIPNKGYHSSGAVTIKDKNGNTSQVHITDPKYISGEFVHIAKNRILVKDTSGNNYSVYKDDPKYISGELIPIMKGRATVKDKDGNTLSISLDDHRLLSGELVHASTNKILVKDNIGNNYSVYRDDPRYISEELIPVRKGQVTVNDELGNTLTICNTDIRYLSGELKSINCGKTIAKDNLGNLITINVNDPRFLSGELTGMMKDKWVWNKYIYIHGKWKYVKEVADSYTIKITKLKDYLDRNNIFYKLKSQK